jgi:prepilin-type N-terminal cleavage/methylation domain-containing protein/prepilin-type processing-associated H-X9-DG protein
VNNSENIRTSKKQNVKNGFTLVELLVVIVMIAVLATISVSVIFRFRKSADKTVALGALRQIQTANTNYAADYNGRFVSPQSDVDGITYRWFENPEFVSHIKGDDATYTSNGTPDVTLPISLMDPAVVRERSPKYTSLEASYGYAVALEDDAPRQSQLIDAARSAAFVTSSKPFVDHATKSEIAYRHNDKALAAFYDGHVKPVSLSDMAAIDSQGGASNIFWKAKEAPTVQ